jgi:hypothetical protein
MTAPARHASARAYPYGAFDADEEYSFGDLSPGERIGSPLRRRGKALRRAGFLALIALGGGWAVYGERVPWPSWPALDIASLSQLMERRSRSPVEPLPPAASPARVADADPPAKPPQEIQTLPLAPSSAAASRSASPPLTTAAVPTETDDAPSEPLPPPSVDPSDPYQARALAVGLHPGLSRVLLERLSSTDYRNAGIAIKTAIAETPDDGVLVWPRQRKPELALFHVHFVRGAAPDCRRYVVTVAKDGWSTTALPMEKCGIQPGKSRRG